MRILLFIILAVFLAQNLSAQEKECIAHTHFNNKLLSDHALKEARDKAIKEIQKIPQRRKERYKRFCYNNSRSFSHYT